jgi:tetratricopeptide (TPR) repeat protein
MKCPVCGTVYRPVKASKEAGEEGNRGAGVAEDVISISAVSSPPSLACRRCKADLSDLICLHDQAIWYHREALYFLSQGLYSEAEIYNNKAIALHYSNADFHALAGKLRALQGEFRKAISAWQQALKFDPQNAIACNCLKMCLQMIEDVN